MISGAMIYVDTKFYKDWFSHSNVDRVGYTDSMEIAYTYFSFSKLGQQTKSHFLQLDIPYRSTADNFIFEETQAVDHQHQRTNLQRGITGYLYFVHRPLF
jgi:dTDP-D-glucose 4,6-dehydratase